MDGAGGSESDIDSDRERVRPRVVDSAPVSNPLPLSADSTASEHTALKADTVVVGAGIAGLSVARALAAPDHSVVVVESTGRVGGRLRSIRDDIDGRGLDLGATWCWPGELRVTSLVHELGIALHDQHIAGDAMYDGPDGAVRLDGNPIDVPAYRFTQGADTLTDRLAADLARRDGASIFLHTRAASIADDPESRRMIVRCSQKTNDAPTTLDVSARHVVIALPPAIAARTIDIDLPRDVAELAASTPVWMGATTKVVVRYHDAFWRRDGLSGSGVSHRGPLREVHDLSGPDGQPAALFGFGSSVDRPVTENDVVTQLTRLFGPSATQPAAVHIADWQSTLPEANRLHDYGTYGHRLFQQPTCDGRVHWVSTETSTDQPGHIEGALAAAERAVTAIRGG